MCIGLLAGAFGSMLAGQANQPQVADDLPHLQVKQKPESTTFNDCPPEGKGGDADLNRLKNRVDASTNYHPLAFHTILDLPWPRIVDKASRASWRPSAKQSVDRYEGTPVTVVGYLVMARLEKKESCNCESMADNMHDIHVWLTAEHQDDEERSQAIIVEVTPRIRAKHPAWTPERIIQLGKAKTHVRISGWLLLDQEHPEQLDHTRGTLWEIHPVMEIEVEKNGEWVKLDD